MRNLLGGKGANLAEMASIGLPVPPGFTITTEVCTAYYDNGRKYPDDLDGQVAGRARAVEDAVGLKFGDAQKPLLVSVRSGARVSMPGMMDTVLNLGLNDETVRGLEAASGDPRFAWDSYRRFIQMYGSVVLGVDHHRFEEIIETAKLDAGVTEDTALSPRDWRQWSTSTRTWSSREAAQPFPMDPHEQLWGAIGAVFGSWMNPRANTYRRLHDIPATWGTAVNVQAMVFGNMGQDCATGVCFTRDPSTGENIFYGEFLVNAQGEDVVAGIRTPQPLSKLRAEPRRGQHGGSAALRLRRPRRRPRDAREPLPRHAGHRVHRAAEQAVHAADPQRQAHRRRLPAHRGRDGRRRADRPGRGDQARQPRLARPAAAPHAGPQGPPHAASQGPARQPRRRQRRRRVQRRRGREPRRQGRGRHPGPHRDQPRGHPRHARRPRHPHHPRRHDQPRRRGRPRHGPPLRLRRRRHQRRLRRADPRGVGNQSAAARSSPSTAPPARSSSAPSP